MGIIEFVSAAMGILMFFGIQKIPANLSITKMITVVVWFLCATALILVPIIFKFINT